MSWAYYASIVVPSTLFLFYGIACLFFEDMRRDFERLMFVGVATRIRVLDPLAQTLQVLVLMFVNLFEALAADAPETLSA